MNSVPLKHDSRSSAIFFHPEAYTTSGPKLMGRNAAGESFLRGYLKYSQAPSFWAQVQNPEHGEYFAKLVSASGRKEDVGIVTANNLSSLGKAGLLYCPGPGIGQHAFQRAIASGSNASWSLCGVTHTTSSAGAMDAICELITAPVQKWDALICTSTAVKNNVTRMLQAQVDTLKERLGITKLVLPMLPVIPLGIHTQDFEFNDEQKASARNHLGADSDTIVVLYMGRLSFHAKSHPLAMYQALQVAAKRAKAHGKRVKLVECGWHANEYIQKAYADAAKLACPDVEVITLDGRDAGARQIAWASADVFCALSDNIQETFGIVPIEAMAAGLPVIVSDWDGYKDTVRNEIEGYRVDTLMPSAGLAQDMAQRHALGIDTYDMYCGHTCSLVSVNVKATTEAFTRLFESPSLRRSMGEAGRKRAREVYDWKVIIRQYEDLWSEQHKLRSSELGQPSNFEHQKSHRWPARLDPFYSFSGYPTQQLNANTVLSLSDETLEAATERLKKYQELSMVNFAKWVIPSDAEIAIVLANAYSGPQAAIELVKSISEPRKPFVFRALAWLLKLGILKLHTPDHRT